MPDVYTQGDSVELVAVFEDQDTGQRADPDTLKLRVLAPSTGSTPVEYVFGVDGNVVRDGLGVFTATIVADEAGDWQYEWTSTGDAVPGVAPIGWFPVTPSISSATPGRVPLVQRFACELDDVGALIRARTRDTSGNEIGTFTQATRPTGVEVRRLISQAAAVVAAHLGDVPASAGESARHLVALRAAMLVEISYWPESTNTGETAYERLRTMYEEALAATQDAISGPAGNAGAYSVKTGPVVLADEA